MRLTERQLAALWVMLAFLGLCVMVGFLLIYHLFAVEHADRQAQHAQTNAAIARTHADLCHAIASIPVPVEAAGFVQEEERRAGCPITEPRPLPTPTVTVIVPGHQIVTPGAAHSPGVMAAPTPTVNRPAGTGTAPPSFPPPARPTPTPTPTPSPSPACLLGLLCLR